MDATRIVSQLGAALGATLYARLAPEVDLVPAIKQVCRRHGIERAVVLCCIGSLRQARFSYGLLSSDTRKRTNEEAPWTVDGPLSLLGAQGVVGPDLTRPGDLAVHLHGSVQSNDGAVHGQDFAEEGNLVLNTAEVVLAALSVDLVRRFDAEVNSAITTLAAPHPARPAP